MKFSLPQTYNKRGFTLIELLMVIVIISILAVLAVNAYIYARYKGLLNLQTEKVVESIRSAKYEVTKGRAEGEPVCNALRIVVGAEIIEKHEGEYVGEICKNFLKIGSKYVLSTPVNVGSIKVNGKEADEVFIYFSPPDGEMFVNEGTKSKIDLMMQFGDKDEIAWQREITIDALTNVAKMQPPKK